MSDIITKDRKPKQYFFVNKVRCPYNKCNKQTTHIVCVMVGEHLDIKSLIGAFCENHATKRQQELNEYRDCIIQSINKINKNIENELIREKIEPIIIYQISLIFN